MSFQWPHLLWLLALPVLLAAVEMGRRVFSSGRVFPKIVRARAGMRTLRLESSLSGVDGISEGQAAPALENEAGIFRRASRLRWFLWLGLVFGIFALARPQLGRIEVPVFDQSREIMIALDLSRSMLAPDVKPSRLERSKLLITGLLERLKGERVGLVVFSGTAFLQSPLSADYEILREFLPVLNPGYLPEGGTNYRALLEASLSSFGDESDADRFLVILSDGEALDDQWKPLVEKLKEKNIRVIGLGVGTETGAMLPDGSGGFIKDERGAAVLSKLESLTLRELAEATGGVYVDASTWVDLAKIVEDTVAKGKKGTFREENRVRLAERFQWPLAAAALFLLLSLWREFPVTPRLREVKLQASAASRINIQPHARKPGASQSVQAVDSAPSPIPGGRK